MRSVNSWMSSSVSPIPFCLAFIALHFATSMFTDLSRTRIPPTLLLFPNFSTASKGDDPSKSSVPASKPETMFSSKT